MQFFFLSSVSSGGILIPNPIIFVGEQSDSLRLHCSVEIDASLYVPKPERPPLFNFIKLPPCSLQLDFSFGIMGTRAARCFATKSIKGDISYMNYHFKDGGYDSYTLRNLPHPSTVMQVGSFGNDLLCVGAIRHRKDVSSLKKSQLRAIRSIFWSVWTEKVTSIFYTVHGSQGYPHWAAMKERALNVSKFEVSEFLQTMSNHVLDRLYYLSTHSREHGPESLLSLFLREHKFIFFIVGIAHKQVVAEADIAVNRNEAAFAQNPTATPCPTSTRGSGSNDINDCVSARRNSSSATAATFTSSSHAPPHTPPPTPPPPPPPAPTTENISHWFDVATKTCSEQKKASEFYHDLSNFFELNDMSWVGWAVTYTISADDGAIILTKSVFEGQTQHWPQDLRAKAVYPMLGISEWVSFKARNYNMAICKQVRTHLPCKNHAEFEPERAGVATIYAEMECLPHHGFKSVYNNWFRALQQLVKERFGLAPVVTYIPLALQPVALTKFAQSEIKHLSQGSGQPSPSAATTGEAPTEDEASSWFPFQDFQKCIDRLESSLGGLRLESYELHCVEAHEEQSRPTLASSSSSASTSFSTISSDEHFLRYGNCGFGTYGSYGSVSGSIGTSISSAGNDNGVGNFGGGASSGPTCSEAGTPESFHLSLKRLLNQVLFVPFCLLVYSQEGRRFLRQLAFIPKNDLVRLSSILIKPVLRQDLKQFLCVSPEGLGTTGGGVTGQLFQVACQQEVLEFTMLLQCSARFFIHGNFRGWGAEFLSRTGATEAVQHYGLFQFLPGQGAAVDTARTSVCLQDESYQYIHGKFGQNFLKKQWVPLYRLVVDSCSVLSRSFEIQLQQFQQQHQRSLLPLPLEQIVTKSVEELAAQVFAIFPAFLVQEYMLKKVNQEKVTRILTCLQLTTVSAKQTKKFVAQFSRSSELLMTAMTTPALSPSHPFRELFQSGIFTPSAAASSSSNRLPSLQHMTRSSLQFLTESFLQLHHLYQSVNIVWSQRQTFSTDLTPFSFLNHFLKRVCNQLLIETMTACSFQKKFPYITASAKFFDFYSKSLQVRLVGICLWSFLHRKSSGNDESSASFPQYWLQVQCSLLKCIARCFSGVMWLPVCMNRKTVEKQSLLVSLVDSCSYRVDLPAMYWSSVTQVSQNELLQHLLPLLSSLLSTPFSSSSSTANEANQQYHQSSCSGSSSNRHRSGQGGGQGSYGSGNRRRRSSRQENSNEESSSGSSILSQLRSWATAIKRLLKQAVCLLRIQCRLAIKQYYPEDSEKQQQVEAVLFNFLVEPQQSHSPLMVYILVRVIETSLRDTVCKRRVLHSEATLSDYRGADIGTLLPEFDINNSYRKCSLFHKCCLRRSCALLIYYWREREVLSSLQREEAFQLHLPKLRFWNAYFLKKPDARYHLLQEDYRVKNGKEWFNMSQIQAACPLFSQLHSSFFTP